MSQQHGGFLGPSCRVASRFGLSSEYNILPPNSVLLARGYFCHMGMEERCSDGDRLIPDLMLPLDGPVSHATGWG